MGAIADWKMDMMAYYIFKRFSLAPSDFNRKVYSIYKDSSGTDQKDYEVIIKNLTSQIEKERMKLDNLTNMRMEGEISKDEYLNYKEKAVLNILRLEEEIVRLKKEELSHTEQTSDVLSPEQIYE